MRPIVITALICLMAVAIIYAEPTKRIKSNPGGDGIPPLTSDQFNRSGFFMVVNNTQGYGPKSFTRDANIGISWVGGLSAKTGLFFDVSSKITTLHGFGAGPRSIQNDPQSLTAYIIQGFSEGFKGLIGFDYRFRQLNTDQLPSFLQGLIDENAVDYQALIGGRYTNSVSSDSVITLNWNGTIRLFMETATDNQFLIRCRFLNSVDSINTWFGGAGYITGWIGSDTYQHHPPIFGSGLYIQSPRLKVFFLNTYATVGYRNSFAKNRFPSHTYSLGIGGEI